MSNKLGDLAKNILKDKKKLIIVGLAGLGVVTVISAAIAIPLATRSSSTKTPPPVVSTFVTTNATVLSGDEVEIEVSGLDNYKDQELIIEYKEKDNTSAKAKQEKFKVSAEKQQKVIVSGLKPWTKYTYLVKQGDKVISTSEIFTPYSDSKVTTLSTEGTISFTITINDTDYKKDQLVMRWAKASSGQNASYATAGLMSPNIVEKTVDGKTTFVLSGMLPSLDESTPYNLFLGLKGQKDPLIEPLIAWTKGSHVRVFVAKRSSQFAIVQVSGLDNFISKPEEGVTFALKYWKTAAGESSAKKESINLPTDPNKPIVDKTILGLASNTDYQVQLLKIKNGVEELQGSPDDFKTLAGVSGEVPSAGVGGGDTDKTVPPVIVKSEAKASVGIVEGTNFTDNLTFNVKEMKAQFPTSVDLTLQWRVKPTVNTSWVAPSSDDSKDFLVSSVPTSGTYSFVVPNSGITKTIATGVDYEWRLIRKATNDNLLNENSGTFKLNDDKLTKTYTTKVPSSDYSSIRWRAPLYQNIVGSAQGGFEDLTMWRPFFGYTTKKEWQDFLEWLAFQNNSIQSEVIENIKQAFITYTSGTGSSGLNQRFTAVPYLPSDAGGDASNGTKADFKKHAAENEPRFGGYNANENTGDSLKPSDFMDSNNKFKQKTGERVFNDQPWDDFHKSIRYLLKGIKDGWDNRVTPYGISKNNMFANSLFGNMSKAYASQFASKAEVLKNFTFAPTETGWTFEVLDNDATNNNIWADDRTGELHIKLKATKGEKTIYYWTTVNGFQTLTNNTSVDASDLTFELYKDHTVSALLMNKELEAATSVAAKKAIIEKYFKVKYPSIYTGWTFVSANLSTDKSSLVLVAKLSSKTFAQGTWDNPQDKKTVVNSSNQTYTIKGYNLNELPALKKFLNDRWYQFTNSSPETSNKNTHYLQINWTYEQMLNKMKDAYIQGTAQVEALADQILALPGIAVWTQTNSQVHLRAAGKLYAGSPQQGDKKWFNDVYWTTDAKKLGFTTRAVLGTNDAATKKQRIIDMINHYGK